MNALRRLAAILLLAMWATAAHGDGGTMLLHQDAGAFTLTLFAAPQPLHVGRADMSVMAQDRGSGEVLLDPIMELTLAPAALNAKAQTVRLARGQASNHLLQAATVNFSSPGKYRLTLRVQRASDAALLSAECTVEPDRSRAKLVWFYVLLPVGVILLFVVHQVLKHRSGGKAS